LEGIGKENTMWVLDIGYPVTDQMESWTYLDGDIDEVVGEWGRWMGSGCGFGTRDVQIEFDHQVDAAWTYNDLMNVIGDKVEYLGLSQETVLP
jgi:hypothetical protein